MLDSIRISLKVLNAAQLAAVALVALLLAWIGTALLGADPALDAERRAGPAAARTFAEAIDAKLRESVGDARTAALLLRSQDPTLSDGERTGLLQDWLALNPRYHDAALIGPDGLVRAAADARRPGTSVAREAWFARARHAGIVIATHDGGEAAAFDLVLSLGTPGHSDRLQLRAGPAFLDLAARVRRALDLPEAVAFTVTGPDGRVLAGARTAPASGVLSASVPVQGDGELGRPGWLVTASMPAETARRLPSRPALIFALLVVGAAAGIGYALGGRAARPLRRLAEGSAGPEESSPVTEIAALSASVSGRSESAETALAIAGTGLDRIKGRLRTFEAMSGWTCWEIDPDTRQVVWSDADSTGTAMAADHATHLSDLAAGFDPADHALLDLALKAAREADGPHDVVLRARADDSGQISGRERRVLIRFLRDDDGRRIHALSRVIEEGEPSETPAGLNERRRNLVLRRVTDGIVHDFNNVLTVVLSNLGILRRRPGLPPEQRHLVDAAMAGALRGAALTRRMLNFARGDSDGLAESDIVASIGTALAFMQANALRDVPVINRVTGDLPKVLCAERILEITLLNIAFHFRDHGLHGFAVGAVAETVETETGFGLPPGLYVRLLIASGQRLPGRIPGPLPTSSRLDALRTVPSLLAEVGAGWRVVSDGTGEEAFVAEIWLKAVARPVAEPVQVQESLNILLVESDSLVRSSVAGALTDLGHRVVQAASGDHALELLNQSAAYDAMIADQSMPVMTGLQLAATVVERHPAIRIILASPHGQLPATARQFLRLDKPFGSNDLTAVLSAAKAA